MNHPLIAVVGDANPQRNFDPAMRDPSKAQRAAEELGAELARRGARLLVYGGPYIEAQVVKGFVEAKPSVDRCILMWYSKDQQPPDFPEQAKFPKLFEQKAERGTDWEVAFYRSLTHADGLILIGGANATSISGYVAIGARMPIIAISEFGGGASRVWNALSPGEDLPTRDDLSAMARPWSPESAAQLVDVLYTQHARRRRQDGQPRPALSIVAALLFLAALAIVPWIWGGNAFAVWMLFLAPLLAGGAGAAIRPAVDHVRGAQGFGSAIVATLVLGLVAGGMAGVLFVTAQLTADPQLTADMQLIVPYAKRSIPFAVAVGFIAGLTADAVFGKLLGLDVVRPSAVVSSTARPS